MVKIFYSIFNNEELLFANSTQFDTKKEAIDSLKNLHRNIIKKPNVKIVEYTNEKLKFIDSPMTELESEEVHTFQILKGVD